MKLFTGIEFVADTVGNKLSIKMRVSGAVVMIFCKLSLKKRKKLK